MAPGGGAATGTKGPRQATGRKKIIYIQLASFLPVQFSNNPPLARLFFFFFSLDLSPFLPCCFLGSPWRTKECTEKEQKKRR